MPLIRARGIARARRRRRVSCRATNRTTRCSPPRLAVPRTCSRPPRRGRDPEMAVRHAQAMVSAIRARRSSSLPCTREAQARDPALAEIAAGAGFCYLPGGDPGPGGNRPSRQPGRQRAHRRVEETARRWRVRRPARWRCVQTRWCVNRSRAHATSRGPGPRRGATDAAVLPHHDTFGAKWYPSARAALPDAVLIGVDERTCALWEAGIVAMPGRRWRSPCTSLGGDAVRVGVGSRSRGFLNRRSRLTR